MRKNYDEATLLASRLTSWMQVFLNAFDWRNEALPGLKGAFTVIICDFLVERDHAANSPTLQNSVPTLKNALEQFQALQNTPRTREPIEPL